jgi:hypothetical protein
LPVPGGRTKKGGGNTGTNAKGGFVVREVGKMVFFPRYSVEIFQ